jgi:type IX secretion system PorP/SprF family membrane protein
MKKIYFIPFLFLLLGTLFFQNKVSLAQENTLFSQYHLNRLSYTPNGVLDSSKVSFFYRKQWLGLEDAPETFAFMGNISLGNMGFGLRALQDRAGLFSQGAYLLSYAYNLKLNEESRLQLGTSLGFKTIGLNSSRLSDKDFSDPVVLRARDNTSFSADFGVSYISKNFEANIAFPHLFQKQLQSNEVSIQTVAQNYHLISSLVYHFSLSNMPLKISPQVFYKLGAAKGGQFDLMLRAEWDEKIWLGAMYRTDFGFAPCVGVKIKDFSLGYSFEISPVERGARGDTSHELLLSYRLPFSFHKKAKVSIDTVAVEKIVEIKNTDTVKVEQINEPIKTEEKAVAKWEKGKIYSFSEIQFNQGTAELLPQSKAFLEKMVEELEKYEEAKIEIAVHTDNILNSMSSRVLSEQRAKAIQEYLVKQGLRRADIAAVGYGNSKAIFKTDNLEEDKKNERVELKILE